MSAATLALIKQAVRNQSMSFFLRNENGFTREEASELMRWVREARNNEAVQHDRMETGSDVRDDRNPKERLCREALFIIN